jgi:MoaA/NifB/PqqE/SkfB family radical SAM enzyme
MARNSSESCSGLDKNFFYISPFGDIQLCPAIPVSFGNIRAEGLDSILNRMWSHEISKTKCRGCIMNDEGFRKKFPELWQDKTELPINAYESKKKH